MTYTTSTFNMIVFYDEDTDRFVARSPTFGDVACAYSVLDAQTFARDWWAMMYRLEHPAIVVPAMPAGEWNERKAVARAKAAARRLKANRQSDKDIADYAYNMSRAHDEALQTLHTKTPEQIQQGVDDLFPS
jgi:hypothetical protein